MSLINCQHAYKRAKERYAAEINSHDLANMIDLIRVGHSMAYGTLGNRQIHYLAYNKNVFKVVYDFKLNAIITFLPYKDNEYALLVEQKRAKNKLAKEEAVRDAVALLLRNGYWICKQNEDGEILLDL